MNEYVNRVLNHLKQQYAHEPEYLQCVQTWLEMIEPAVDDPAMNSRICSPAW